MSRHCPSDVTTLFTRCCDIGLSVLSYDVEVTTLIYDVATNVATLEFDVATLNFYVLLTSADVATLV